jgi:osmotically inducible protein OsmC
MSAEDRNLIVREGHAEWTGTLPRGEGRLSTGSGVLRDQRFAFATRFGQERGTNPEELIAAAHAGCFSMGLVYLLSQAGVEPQRVETSATLTVRLSDQGPEITGIQLRTRAKAGGIASQAFDEVAQRAKETCLVSRLVKVPVTLEATLLE